MDYQEYYRSYAAKQWLSDPEQYHDIAKSREIFDESFVDTWWRDPQYIERLILNHIVETFQLSVYFEFLVVNWQNSNARSCKQPDGIPSMMLIDKVLDFSIMEVFLTVWAAEYRPECFDLCKKHLKELIDDKLVRRVNSSDDRMDIIQEAQMPDLAVQQAFDMYWAAWTFVVGHELFHILKHEELSNREEEFSADRFGFQVLIRLIEEQKAGMLPKELDCYYEEYYLVPCMLMHIFGAMDRFRAGQVKYGGDKEYPSPEEWYYVKI